MGVYAFPHLTFQEYLAASDVERRLAHSIEEIWAVIQPHLHDPHWREVILLLLGRLNKFERHPTELVRRIYERTDEYEDVLHRHLFLAARALADRVEVDAALHDAIVDHLLDLARTGALEALGQLQGDGRAAAGLLALARGPQVGAVVRGMAAKTLGQLGRADEAAPILLALARDDGAPDHVRSVAYDSLKSLLGGEGGAWEIMKIRK
ncbi:MAG: hypothetical protein ACE5GO_05770 [Anaerolineales bacterium]